MTTFQAFAARAGLPVEGYESRVDGVLDKTPAGLAKRHCIVANSLKTAVELHVVVASRA